MNAQGTWYNELGSVMTLTVNGSAISGTYQTAVGNAQGQYALTGGLDTSPTSGGTAIGFTVAWVNQYGSANSVTSWSGQLQMVNGQPTIVAAWLLTNEMPAQDDWASTLVGQDVFTPNAPQPAQVEKRLKAGHVSHPHARRFKKR